MVTWKWQLTYGAHSEIGADSVDEQPATGRLQSVLHTLQGTFTRHTRIVVGVAKKEVLFELTDSDLALGDVWQYKMGRHRVESMQKCNQSPTVNIAGNYLTVELQVCD